MIWQEQVTPAQYFAEVNKSKKKPVEKWSDYEEMLLCNECDALEAVTDFCVKCGSSDVKIVKAKVKRSFIYVNGGSYTSITDRVIREDK